MRAEAHLHIGRFRSGKQDCISVRNLPEFGVHYSGTVVMKDVKFSVQPAGLKRFREQGQKNVHAFVRGEIIADHGNQIPKDRKTAWLWREAYYNPAVTDTFVDRQTGEPLSEADAAYLIGNKVYYMPKDKK